jgi:hypothetical protein
LAKPDASNFRRWLVEKVSLSRWPNYIGDTDETIAHRIGVEPEVLVEARALILERTKSERAPNGVRLGMPKSRGRRSARSMLFLEPPPEIYAEWKARRDERGMENATLLRSICHHVLQLRTQPAWLSQSSRKGAWVFRGAWHRQSRIRDHLYRIKCDLSDAAYRAMHIRAENTRVNIAAIARWGVCLFVAGRLDKMTVVSSLNALYKTPNDYCLSPEVTG